MLIQIMLGNVIFMPKYGQFSWVYIFSVSSVFIFFLFCFICRRAGRPDGVLVSPSRSNKYSVTAYSIPGQIMECIVISFGGSNIPKWNRLMTVWHHLGLGLCWPSAKVGSQGARLPTGELANALVYYLMTALESRTYRATSLLSPPTTTHQGRQSANHHRILCTIHLSKNHNWEPT